MSRQRSTIAAKVQINGLRVPADVVAEIDRRAQLNLRSRAAEASYLLTQGVAFALRADRERERRSFSVAPTKPGRS